MHNSSSPKFLVEFNKCLIQMNCFISLLSRLMIAVNNVIVLYKLIIFSIAQSKLFSYDFSMIIVTDTSPKSSKALTNDINTRLSTCFNSSLFIMVVGINFECHGERVRAGNQNIWTN